MIAKEKINLAISLFNHAYDLQVKGKLNDAIKNYLASIDIYPTPEAYTFLGWAYSMQGKFEQAIEQCKVAIEIDPAYGNPYNDIGAYLISLKRYNEAIPWLQKALKATRYEHIHYSYFNLGRAYEIKGDWFEALRLYDKAIEISKDYKAAKDAKIDLIAKLN